MTTTPNPVPQLLVEQLALGELPPAEAEAVRRRLAAEPGGLDRLAALAADDAATLAALPPRLVAAQVKARALAERRAEAAAPAPRRWPLPTVVGLAAAAGLALWITPGVSTIERGQQVELSERAKGDPALLIYQVDKTGAAPLQAHSEAHAGDTLQLTYRRGGATDGVIVSIDGRGVATLHFPDAEGGPTALRRPEGQQPTVALSHSYQLDDAPRFERFFFVTADHPIDAGEIMARAERLAQSPEAATAPLSLPAGLRQTTVHLEKSP